MPKDYLHKHFISQVKGALDRWSGNGSVAANIQPLTVTANGTYPAAEGVDGYSPVTVALPKYYGEYEVAE